MNNMNSNNDVIYNDDNSENGDQFIDDMNDVDNIEYLEFLEYLNKEKIELNERINIIDPKEIMYITEKSKIDLSRIYHDFKALMYYHFIIVRKISTLNTEFVKFFIPCISKVVHPNIQLFYGLMFEKEKVMKSTGISKGFTVINEEKDSDNVGTSSFYKKKNDTKDNLNHIKNITLSVILELCRGIKINKINEVSLKLNLIDTIILKLVILRKISQIVFFLHKSNVPHLLLNSNKIFIDNEMIMKESIQKSIINKDDSYIECNMLKVTDVGMFYSLSKDLGFDLIHNDIYEIKFIHPELLLFYTSENDKKITDICRRDYIRYDTWSLLCIILEILSEEQILNYISSLDMIKNFYQSFALKYNNFEKKDDYSLFIEIHAEILNSIKSKYSEVLDFYKSFEEMLSKVLDSKVFNVNDRNSNNYGINQSALKYLDMIIKDLRNSRIEKNDKDKNNENNKNETDILEVEKKESENSSNKLIHYQNKFKSYNDYELGRFIHRTKIKDLIDESIKLNNDLKILRHDDYVSDL